MNLKNIGEFNLINAIKKATRRTHGGDRLSIGDDAAAFPIGDNKLCLVTTDISIEDVHFDLRYFSLFQAGWKSMTANLSDIAAMGGTPTYGFVSLGVPSSYTGENIEELYQGITGIADKYKTEIIGGDTSSADKLIISITLLGEVSVEGIIPRSGAQRNEAICVTGDLGKSEAGMKVLREFKMRKKMSKALPAFLKNEDWEEVTRAHLEPIPRFAELKAVLEHARPNAMIDISDGLSRDLSHLCQESQKGADIYLQRIPVHLDAEKIARLSSMDPIELALHSGEEFELLFTLPRENAAKICKEVRMATGTEVTIIGEIKPKTDGINVIGSDGQKRPMKVKGWDHFK